MMYCSFDLMRHAYTHRAIIKLSIAAKVTALNEKIIQDDTSSPACDMATKAKSAHRPKTRITARRMSRKRAMQFWRFLLSSVGRFA